MYSGHLRRQHHFELIPRLNTFQDGKHEIEAVLANLVSLRTGACQLVNETMVEVEISGAERVHQQHLAGEVVWMLGRDLCDVSLQDLEPRCRVGSISSEKFVNRGPRRHLDVGSRGF